MLPFVSLNFPFFTFILMNNLFLFVLFAFIFFVFFAVEIQLQWLVEKL